jgi:septum formation protein
MSEEARIILASASPRRHELLARIGVGFIAIDADIDESRRDGEMPERYVRRLAREKALAGWRRRQLDLPSLGADTVVVLDGEIMGKPGGRDEAAAMLRRLSGRQHQVLSAVALVLDEQRVLCALSTTSVTFEPLGEDWIRAYCASDEPMDKAGAYAIQGQAGERVRSVDGSFSGVMGLPLEETRELLTRAGIPSESSVN